MVVFKLHIEALHVTLNFTHNLLFLIPNVGVWIMFRA